MDFEVYGLAEEMKHWYQLREVFKVCRAAAVPVPQAVLDFFGPLNPDEGPSIKLPQGTVLIRPPKVVDNCVLHVAEIDLTKVPAGTKYLVVNLIQTKEPTGVSASRQT
jgi:hypothetical protein